MKSSPGTVKQVAEWVENALKEAKNPDVRKKMKEQRMQRAKKELHRYGF